MATVTWSRIGSGYLGGPDDNSGGREYAHSTNASGDPAVFLVAIYAPRWETNNCDLQGAPTREDVEAWRLSSTGSLVDGPVVVSQTDIAWCPSHVDGAEAGLGQGRPGKVPKRRRGSVMLVTLLVLRHKEAVCDTEDLGITDLWAR